MTSRAGDRGANTGLLGRVIDVLSGLLGRVIDRLLAPVAMAIGVALFAHHVTRNRWERVAVWGVQLCLVVMPFVLASYGVISANECIALVIVAFAAFPLSSRLSARLEPRERRREQARWARDDLARERKRLAARAMLDQELAIPRRVLAVPNGFVVVEGGYILDSTPGPNLPESMRSRFTSELTRVIAGRQITARLVDDFMQFYVPNGFSGGMERVRLGPGYRYGMIPVDLVVDGRVLVWKDSGFVFGEVDQAGSLLHEKTLKSDNVPAVPRQ